MKKREIFWLNRILIIILISIIFIVVSIYNIVQFNNSYIIDEKSEMEIFRKQIEWAITPMLKNNDFVLLKKYASDFENDKEFTFRIFDNNKNLIISTFENNNTEIKTNDHRISKKKYDIWEMYIESFHDKSLEKISEIKIGSKKYYLEVALSQEFVISSIIKAQENIMLVFYLGIIVLLFGLIYTFYTIRKSFNLLEDSVIQISKGNLDTAIELPKNGLLYELSLAIARMTNRLRKQILRLTQLEEYKSEFVTNVSHEIKTPITAINSAIELIDTSGTLNNSQSECFDIIKSQSIKINSLVNDILTLSELDLEKTSEQNNFKTVNLNQVVQEILSEQIFTKCKIKFNPQKEYEVLASKEMVIAVIYNLLSNAIKYSNSDIVEINLYDNNKKIVLEIKDHGIGISKEHLPRIFERFYRVDKTRSRKNGGTGLGLAIVKNIVEIHKWEIEVESEIGKGTCFRIKI